jgi:hypothetical protein
VLAREERPVRDFLRAWDQFWFAPRAATSLAVMRIFAGGLMLYVYLGYSLALLSYVGPNSWVGLDVLDYMRHDIPISAPSTSWDGPDVVVTKGQFTWSPYYHVEDPAWIWTIHAGVMLATLLFTVGFATRVTSVLAWAGGVMYIHRASTTLFGMDTMTNLGLLYLMIAPCGAVLSVDRWLEVRRLRRQFGSAFTPPTPLLPSATFATRLVQINFCIIYLMAGMSKLLGTTWWNATAPSLFLLNYSFAPFNSGLYSQGITWLAGHRWLWEAFNTFGVVFTLSVELGLPFLVWNSRLRWVMMIGSAMLHTMIGLLMGLVTFSLMMLILLLGFMPPEVMDQVLARLGQMVRQLRQPPAAGPPTRKAEGPLALAR